MDITTILNRKNSAALIAAEAQFAQQLAQSAQLDSRGSSEMGSEQGASHPGEHPMMSYPSHAPAPPLQQTPSVPPGMRYPSPTHPNNGVPMMSNTYVPGPYPPSADTAHDEPRRTKSGGDPPPKTFHCGTCAKGFARRSDLARHGESRPQRTALLRHIELTGAAERIHTGIRPHACEWPGCGKQFIQRSALTVHSRVHTGEKPHMCERCGKVCCFAFPLAGRYFTDTSFSSSPSAIHRRWRDIAGSIRANGRTSVLTQTAKRPSRVAPH